MFLFTVLYKDKTNINQGKLFKRLTHKFNGSFSIFKCLPDKRNAVIINLIFCIFLVDEHYILYLEKK